MKITRRSFLKTSIAVPTILPLSAWASQTAPSERITVGVIGTGMQSHHLLQQFMFRSQVVAVCDVDTKRREDACKTIDEFYTRYPDLGSPGCKAYNNYEELVARDDIDAVCIATPDHWHSIMTIAALRSGKDVYCEKPLTHNIAQAVDVMKEVEAQKRILQTGSMQRSMREFRVACELVRNGLIGKIDHIEAFFGGPSVPCDLPAEEMESGLDWNLWIGPAPMRPYNHILSPRGVHNHYPMWRAYQEFGTGMVGDWGAHQLDIVQWAMGTDDSGPVKVIPPEDKAATQGARLVYANGIEVTHKHDGAGAKVYGSEGQVYVHRGRFEFIQNGKTIAKFISREDGGSLESKLTMVEREYLKDAKVKLYKNENHVEDFLECVKSRKKPITHEGIGARSAICCHLLNIVYHHGQEIKWDPALCTFAEGSGDSSWLTEPKRDYKKEA